MCPYTVIQILHKHFLKFQLLPLIRQISTIIKLMCYFLLSRFSLFQKSDSTLFFRGCREKQVIYCIANGAFNGTTSWDAISAVSIEMLNAHTFPHRYFMYSSLLMLQEDSY
jgi:hypothetical protein